jgi:putative glutamine amidotransferase
MTRPLIGITGPNEGGYTAYLFTRLAVMLAGGRSRRITPSRPCTMDELDGLVVGGGADVSPTRYEQGEEEKISVAIKESKVQVRKHKTPRLSMFIAPFVLLLRKLLAKQAFAGPDPARDELESALISRALELERPVLGICRGAQLLNVQCGGTLFRDLAQFYTETPQLFTVLPKKSVDVKETSHLAQAIGAGKCRVNALHKQAVRNLGNKIRVAACEANGVVQAIEHAEKKFVVGVQWHPEYIPQHRRQRRLFAALVHAARISLEPADL